MNLRAFSKSPLFLSMVLFCLGGRPQGVKRLKKKTARTLNRCLFFFFLIFVSAGMQKHCSIAHLEVVNHPWWNMPCLLCFLTQEEVARITQPPMRQTPRRARRILTHNSFVWHASGWWPGRRKKKKTAQKNKTVKRWNPKYRESLENLSKRKLLWRDYEKTKSFGSYYSCPEET